MVQHGFRELQVTAGVAAGALAILTFCIAAASLARDPAATKTRTSTRASRSQPAKSGAKQRKENETSARTASDSSPFDGLWAGSWGGGMREGVVFQPVLAELLIQGDHVELAGFPNTDNLAGKVSFDATAKRMRITLVAEEGQPAPEPIEFSCELREDSLTLVDSQNSTICFARDPAKQEVCANIQIELVMASGIDEAGLLLVTEFDQLSVGQARATQFEPRQVKLGALGASVLVVREAELQPITIEEARALLAEPTVVAVTYLPDDAANAYQSHELWRNIGTPSPATTSVHRTLARTLRPGALVFVLSAAERGGLP